MTTRPPRVLLLCGGASEEHEVSLASARSVLDALAGTCPVHALVIDRGGRLLSPAESARALTAGSAPAGSGELELARLRDAYPQPAAFDVVFPILHGPNGEDGTVQGLLSLLGLPFVGSGVLGSAVGMDKLMMKSVLAAHSLPQTRYRGISRAEWRREREALVRDLGLDYPLFVKPANLGSSVGISKVEGEAELAGALDEAFRFDRRAIVEEGVTGARELEVGVLGNDDPAASPVGEITYASEFYDYDTKYTEGCAELTIPARIPEEVAERCRALALAAFRACDAAGLARVDFFWQEETGRLFVNELNTMPGFTTTSMYAKLWEAAGVPYPDLVARLLDLALEER